MPLNPRNTIVGNGTTGSVVTSYSTGSSFWVINTNNVPGNVLKGTFPNPNNIYGIATIPQSYTWPYRGGKNFPNPSPVSITNSAIGITSVGISIQAPIYGQTTIYNGQTWTLIHSAGDILGADIYGGYVNGSGKYQYQDSRFISSNAWGVLTGTTWQGGSYTHPDGHSKIIGWANDGYPIYGPFAYTSATNTLSGITRMVPGYTAVSKPNRPVDRSIVVNGNFTTSTAFLVFSAFGLTPGMRLTGGSMPAGTKIRSISGTVINVDRSISATSGDVLTASFPLGVFVEDYNYSFTTGTTLDSYNGRFSVTPDFPEGTYAYFAATDSSNNPIYPYFIGTRFYGKLTADSTNTGLLNLTPSIGALTPTFSSSTFVYNISVQNSSTSIAFAPILFDPQSTVKIGTSTVGSGSFSQPIALVTGLNTTTIFVTSFYGTTGTYSVTVNRALSSNNFLADLSISEGNIVPTFNSTITDYTAVVDQDINSLTISAQSQEPTALITVNSSTYNTVTGYTAVLNLGVNEYNVLVTAENGSTRNYNLDITRVSDLANLSGLTVSTGTLLPSFTATNFIYRVDLPFTTTSIRVRPTTQDANAVLRVNEVQIPSGTTSSSISLNEGVNPIIVRVTSSDQSVTNKYRILAIRGYDPNANISSISVSTGTLVPTFSSTITSYVSTVSNSTTGVRIRAITSNTNATVSIGSQVLLSGTTSSVVPLVVGVNPIQVIARATDGTTTKTYTLNYRRLPSSISTLSNLVVTNSIIIPSFRSTITNYVATVSNSITSLKVIPTASEPNAVITVNNVNVASGSFSQSINLSVGVNTATTRVVSQDGTSTSTYTVTVNRRASGNSDLAFLSLSNGTVIPDFTFRNYSYTATVAFAITATAVTAFASDTQSTIRLNGNVITSGIQSAGVPLVVGANTLTVSVTALDPAYVSNYRISITREKSPDSSLSNLTISRGILSPSFSPNITEYFVSVSNTVTSVTVTPTAGTAGGRIEIFQKNYTSGQTSDPVNLSPGPNSIPIYVFAPNGISVSYYNVFVTRAAKGFSDNPNLSSLTTDVGPAFGFNPNTTTYNISVLNSISKIKVKANVQVTGTTLKINNQSATPGQFSDSISLSVGVNTISIVALAQDGAATKTYNLNVRRIGSTDANLLDLLPSSSQLDPYFNKDITNYIVKVPYLTNTIAFKPTISDTNAQQSISLDGINRLGIPIGSWTNIYNLNVGNNRFIFRVLAADLATVKDYVVTVQRSSAVVIDPTDLFVIDGSGDFTVDVTPTPMALKIYTKDILSYVRFGTFPNTFTNYTTSTQNIELTYPYKGGESIGSVSPTTKPDDSIIGITSVGIPIKSAASQLKVTGLNGTQWTINEVFSPIFGSDQFGGRPDQNGAYFYNSARLILSNAWQSTPNWQGSYEHPDGHSRIIGFAADGFPIYGPVGYENPTKAGSLAFMYSGYTTVPNANRPQPVTLVNEIDGVVSSISVVDATGVMRGMTLQGPGVSTGTIIARITGNILTLLNTGTFSAGTTLTASYPLGSFIEDWAYTKPIYSTLDQHNGRYCVTPDYPTGTYAYFMTAPQGQVQYPYVIGNTFYGDLLTQTSSANTKPVWVTPQGFIVTATETLSISRTISAVGPSVRYKIISGSLPNGLALNTSTGVISGIPSLVYQVIRSEFVIRAQNNFGLADRRFFIDVQGPTAPNITTPGGALSIGPSGEKFLINKQHVEFQFTATADVLPQGKGLVYYIADGDGELPPGLELSQAGKITGQVIDNLSLYYRAAEDGTYDMEGYDFNPYEHESIQAYGTGGRFVNKVYKFYLTVSNGVGTARGAFQIDVQDPTFYLNSAIPNLYPIAPQWLTPSNLGSVRSGSKIMIELSTFDCYPVPGTTTFDWNIVNNSNNPIVSSKLLNLEDLDIKTGVINGYLNYTPQYSTTYTFKVRVTKTSSADNKVAYRDRTFTLTVLGSVESNLSWITTSTVGTLQMGQISELSVIANNTDSDQRITYSLTSGSLPSGLSLATDGSIQGRLNYFTTSTSVSTFNFTVKAKDSNLGSEITKAFNLKVNGYTGKKYSQILFEPLLTQEDKDYFTVFITNNLIFDQTLLYRPYDNNFGVQRILQFVLEHGIQQLNLASYVPALQNYFYRKKLYFGDLKSAFALDDSHNKIYEVVYVDIIDNLVNESGVPINETVQNGTEVIYPNSIDNMRGALEEIAATDEVFLPKFMRTVQDNSGVPLGRILCLPLCYCLPGNADKIINKIKASGMDFKKINFDIDRIKILNTLDNSTAKYLLFPNRKYIE